MVKKCVIVLIIQLELLHRALAGCLKTSGYIESLGLGHEPSDYDLYNPFDIIYSDTASGSKKRMVRFSDTRRRMSVEDISS